MDKELVDKVKLKDPAANWEDLRVMRSDTCEVLHCSVVDDAASASSLEAAQMNAKFNLMKMKLERERSSIWQQCAATWREAPPI